MGRFLYKAVNSAGDVVEGEMEAAEVSAVIEILRQGGSIPIKAEPALGPAGPARNMPMRRRGLRANELKLVTRELATLLQAGLTIDRSLSILVELAETPRSKRFLTETLAKVRAGAPVAQALAQADGGIPEYYVGMVRAGEAGGALGAVLERIAGFMERQQEMVGRIRSALVYPAILLGMTGVSFIILMVVVVPQFEPVFEDFGQEPPFTFRVVMGISHGLSHYWWALLGMLAAAAWFVSRELSVPASRLRWHRALLRMRLVGPLVARMETASFARTLGLLLRNGVTLQQSLAIVAGSLRNDAFAAAVETMARHIREGRRLASAMAEAPEFPWLAVQLVTVGEETGSLDSMLLRLADIFDGETQRATERFLAILVPALTISLGGLIAVVIGAILSGILSINTLAS